MKGAILKNYITVIEWRGTHLDQSENLLKSFNKIVIQKQPSNKIQLTKAIIQSLYVIIKTSQLINLVD